MKRSAFIRFAMAGAVLTSTLPAVRVQGQQGTSDERLFVYLDDSRTTNRSFAVLRPDGDGSHGALVWACGGSPQGLAVGILLADSGRDRQTRRLSWRVDDAEPVVAGARGEDRAVPWLLPDDAAVAVTARARAAQMLAVRVEDTSGTRPAAEFAYTLAGLDSALSQIGCATGTRAGNRRAGGRTLRILSDFRGNKDEPPSWPPVGIEELPSPSNLPHFQRVLAIYYPAFLRDANITGQVELRFRVMEDGSVDSTSIRVMRSSRPEFTDAAIRSVQELRFSPARINGRAVKVWVELPVHFSPPPPADDSRP